VFFKESATCLQSSECWLASTTICEDCRSVDVRSMNSRVAPLQAVLEAGILCYFYIHPEDFQAYLQRRIIGPFCHDHLSEKDLTVPVNQHDNLDFRSWHAVAS
jgi:hypothetical protein